MPRTLDHETVEDQQMLSVLIKLKRGDVTVTEALRKIKAINEAK